jgi:hypothetical protein
MEKHPFQPFDSRLQNRTERLNVERIVSHSARKDLDGHSKFICPKLPNIDHSTHFGAFLPPRTYPKRTRQLDLIFG